MRKGWINRLGFAVALGWLAASGAGAAGCAAEQPTIIQVQPNFTRKADLVGDDFTHPIEWYVRSTVIDARGSNPFAFIGMQDDLRRIRWDIQEKFLVARLSYERVSGSDGKGADPTKNDGIIVAMYPILSHFDIRRAFDPSTGEERNLLVEDTVDGKWYEHQYMRVDWSTNLVDDPGFAELWFPKVFGDLQFEPVSYFEDDPNSPNRPVTDTQNGYFDVTSKYLIKTESWNLGDFTLPTCLIYNLVSGSETYDCDAQEITVRQSFKKVDPNHDFESIETDGSKFAMFGTFNRDRYGYDRQYKITDSNWHRFMVHHNIWQSSHDGRVCGADGNRTAADSTCSSGHNGSYCDMNAKQCTTPYESRQVKTTPYYVSASMPDDLDDQNKLLVGEWNDAVKGAVAAAREVECVNGGGAAADCHAKHYNSDGTPNVERNVFALCHNPVVDGDDQACGPVGTRAREGDLRYNLIDWVAITQQGPLGYGPDGADPLTGEVVQATAYIYGAELDWYAAYARDLVALADGDLKPEDFANGVHVGQNLGAYVPPPAAPNNHLDPNTPNAALPSSAAAVNAAAAPNPNAASEMDHRIYDQYAKYLSGDVQRFQSGLTDEQIRSRVAGVDASGFVGTIGGKGAIAGAQNGADRFAAVQNAIALQTAAGSPGFGGQTAEFARIQGLSTKAQGTAVETTLVDDRIANSPTGNWTDQNKLLYASPFSGLGPMQFESLQRQWRQNLESNGICYFAANEFNAPHFEGLAKALRAKYASLSSPDRQLAIFQDLRKTIYRAVTEHEVGHTMGLRHNFEGSWDSINYHPNYWKLRTNDGKAAQACATARTGTTDTCMGPRYLDPETPDELGTGATPHSGVLEYSYSSIMDYGYDFDSDLHGIGSYDRAAMKFIYGGVVETFPSSMNTVAADVAPVLSSPVTEQWWVNRDADPGMGSGKQVQPTHYTELARIMKLYDSSRCRAPKDGDVIEQDAAINGQICDPIQKGNARFRDMVSGEVVSGSGVYATAWKNPKTGEIRWPYRFGTDDWAEYPHDLRFDAGADLYEGALNAGRLYDSRYLLDFYRRGRRGWLFFMLENRLWSRYFSRFHQLGWVSGYRTAAYSAMFPGQPAATNPALNNDNWGRPYVMAQANLFDTLTRSALRPQPGGYQLKSPAKDAGETNDIYEVPAFGTGTNFSVGALDGRYIDEVFDQDVGGSFEYLSYLQREGSFSEKPLSTIALTASWAPSDFPPVEFQTRDGYKDGRSLSINFRTTMPQAYDRLVGGILAEDLDTTAPFVTGQKDASGNAVVNYLPLWADSPQRPAGAQLIDPLVGFKFQEPTMIYGLLFGSDFLNPSQTFANSLRIWVEGGPESVQMPDSEKEFFYEPESHVVWATRKPTAMDTIDGKQVPNTIGARMIEHANYLLAQTYWMKVTGNVADGTAYPVLDPTTHMPTFYAEDPSTPGPHNPVDQPVLINDTGLPRLRKFVGVMNVERNLMWWVGMGPLH